MASDCRLLILSCSQRKRSTSNLLPAIERYDGPAFQVLRKFLREFPLEAESLDVYILKVGARSARTFPILCGLPPNFSVASRR